MRLIPLSVSIPPSKTFFSKTTKRSSCRRSFSCRKNRFFSIGDFHCNRGLLAYIIGCIALSNFAFAQEDAWVYFKDKPNAESYLSNPTTMLSQRALNRRNVQNIALDQKDIPLSPSYTAQIKAAAGITVMAKSKWLNALHVRGTVQSIRALSTLPFVNNIDFADRSLNARYGLNPVVHNKTTTTKATKSNTGTTADFNYGNASNQIQMLNGHLLHQQNFTGAGKIIAVLDAGFPGVDVAAPFQRLRDNNLLLGGYNYVNRNTNIYALNRHGTLVLSTMGGYVENQLIGTAPDASYYLFITEDAASENPVEESYWVEAAEAADSLGVDIINTSLGYYGYDKPQYSYNYSTAINGTTSFISRGADIAFSRGMIVVVSAGNSGNQSENHIGVPADAFHVLTVGAVDASRQYASFSSIGPTADGRVKPDVVAKGEAATIADASGMITTASGTSLSAPIMAGMVACLWQALPTKTNAEIVQLIKQSADRFASPTDHLGYGIPNFANALQGISSVQTNKIENRPYPNPFQNQIAIISNTTDNTTFYLFNNLGQLVLSETVQKTSQIFDTAQLSEGIYFYKIAGGSSVKSGKLIKR